MSRDVTPEWLTPARADFALDENLRGGWGVSPAPALRGASFTDFGTHEMAVPTDDTDEARAIRFHELLHVRFSPTSVPTELMDIVGLSKQAVRVAEEVRVNFLGSHLGSELSPGHRTSIAALSDGTERAVADKAVANENWQDALSLFLSSYNTDAFRVVKRRLRRNPEWREPLMVIEKQLESWDYKFDPKGHKGWHRTGSRGQTDPILYRYRDRFGRETQQHLPYGFVNHTMPLAEKIEQWFEHPPQAGGRRVSRRERITRQIERRSGDWETLRFGSVDLTETTASFISRRKRPSMTGKYPSRPDRLLTDPERRIFRETVRGRGGIVIFDCSGSMGVDHDVVRHAVAQFAGATVVVYSHSRTASANAWIVAHNGRMISQAEFDDLPLNCGNGVDGEVLRWAIRNRKDKEFIVWVSDGCVTGRGDRTSDDLLGEVSLLSKRHNIIGVDTCDEALSLLADMKRGKTPRNKYCRIVTNCLNDMNKYLTKREKERMTDV